MRTFALASTAIFAGVLAVGIAEAADLQVQRPAPPPQRAYAPPPPRSFDWTGFYIGANGGWGGGRSRFNFDDLGVSSGHFGVNGWQAGGTAGFNYQVGHVVFGVESDMDWSNISGNTNCPMTGSICQTQNDWLGTARGRVGYAFDRVLPYVTGGAAFGNINASVPGVGSASATNLGWAAGGGIEYAITPNWSTKLEYLHVDLGSFDCGAACNPTPPVNVKLDENLVRAGVNFKFGAAGQ
jgi:outer membrane immunogenic protein